MRLTWSMHHRTCRSATVLDPELAHALEELEPPSERSGLDEHHRLVDEPCDELVDVQRVDVVGRGDGFRRGQVEGSDEPGQSLEDQLFVR